MCSSTMILLLWTVGLTLLALCARTDDFKVVCPDVTAEADSTVILNCHTEPRLNLTDDTVVWTIQNSDTWDYDDFLKYHQGEQTLAKGYEDRASIFVGQLSEGNCSLKLKVKSTDGGRYYGSVSLGGRPVSCHISVTVRKFEGQNVSPPGPPATTTPKPDDDDGKKNNTGVIVSSVVGALVGVALLAVAVLAFLFHSRQRAGWGRSPVSQSDAKDNSKHHLRNSRDLTVTFEPSIKRKI